MFEIDNATTLTVEWLQGYAPDNGTAIGSTTISPTAQGVVSADGDQILSADGDSIVISQTSSMTRALLKSSAQARYLHDTGLRLRIGDNASAGSWGLESISLAYQILVGLQRNMP